VDFELEASLGYITKLCLKKKKKKKAVGIKTM
jgi:hypothetical protein